MKKVKLLIFCTMIIGFLFIGSASNLYAKTYRLSFTQTIPPHIPFGELTQKWADTITEKTDGQVKFKIFWGESLLKASEFYRGVQTGQTDITYYVIGLDWGLMPLNMFTKLAFMGYPSPQQGAVIYKTIWNKYPEIRNEFKSVKVYGPSMSPPNQLHMTSMMIKVPSDLKGRKIVSVGGTLAEEMARMGAAPLDVKVGDLYMSLERKLAEGLSVHFPVVHAFGVLELVPYHTVFPGGGSSSIDMLLFNEKTWNKLPKDIQQAFLSEEEKYSQSVMGMNVGYTNMIKGQAKGMGHQFYEPTPEEMAMWREAVQPVHDKWIKQTEAKGLPAQAIYDEVQQMIKAMSR